MSGFTDLIKRGILSSDWELVKRGYELLTGDSIDLPKHARKVEDNDDGGITGTGVNKKIRAQQVKPKSINLYVDEEGEKRAAKNPIKKKTVSKAKRATPMIDTKCKECKDKYRVRDDFLQSDGSYICNDCILRKGR